MRNKLCILSNLTWMYNPDDSFHAMLPYGSELRVFTVVRMLLVWCVLFTYLYTPQSSWHAHVLPKHQRRAKRGPSRTRSITLRFSETRIF